MYKEEFEKIRAADQQYYGLIADGLFLARRGSSNALNRKFVLQEGTVLGVEDCYVHLLANFTAGMATRVCFYDKKDMFGYHSMQSSFESSNTLWDMLSQVVADSSGFSVRLMDVDYVKCVYLFENQQFVLDSVFATAVFCERFNASSMQFEVGQSFLAGGGNSLVAPKF